MTKRLKIIIIAVIALVLVFAAIWYFSGSNKNAEEGAASQSKTTVSEGQKVQLSQAKDILIVLSLLKTINLSLGFFDNTALKSLYDFSVQLPVSEVGKNNPFTP